MNRVISYLRRTLIVSLLLICLGATALAAAPVTGRVRVVGYKDKVPNVTNMFAAYAVYKNVAHVEGEHYLSFAYLRESSKERHWSLWATDKYGESKPLPKGTLAVYLPYPSIWSKADNAYWKWTERYALKHYEWKYAYGDVKSEFWSPNGFFTSYSRSDYMPIAEESMKEFGPRFYLPSSTLDQGISIWVKINER